MAAGRAGQDPRLSPVVPQKRPLLYFRGFAGPMPRGDSFRNPGPRVTSTMAAGRRMAIRAAAWQACGSVILALAFLTRDAASAGSALFGGGAMVLGGLVLAWFSLKGEAPAAYGALGRLVLGMVARWVVVGVALVVGLGALQLPPLPLLASLVLAFIVGAVASAKQH